MAAAVRTHPLQLPPEFYPGLAAHPVWLPSAADRAGLAGLPPPFVSGGTEAAAKPLPNTNHDCAVVIFLRISRSYRGSGRSLPENC